MLIKKVSKTITNKTPHPSPKPSGCPTCEAPRVFANRHRVNVQAVAVRKHLERNRKDKDSKFRLILIESRIHRLARYYKTVGVLPPTWRYEAATASTLVA